ncbi:MAG: choice-of-anchor D domain-containing protein, partial [Bacteroidetes bacterium]|nr:choice-of-anchor D domain-containing protein [Bacteroidota bacterium]
QVVNDLAVAQTVYFSALDAPFSLVDNSPVEIPADDTTTVTLQFQPTSIGSYSGSLEAVGGVFGSATLNFSGEGIQVVLEWTPESLIFDTTAIGQTDAQVVSITSSGNGDGVISAIEFSNPVFSVDSATSSFTIAEGATNDLMFVFAPTGAGAQSGTATLHTNDPSNPQIVLDLSGTGISEVSGEICDQTWTPSNSPYTLVGDVIVPEGCTLTLEAGTEVIGNDHDIEVFGSFFANGEYGTEVTISCGELISHTAAEQMVLTHSTITETNEFEFFDADFRVLRDDCDSLYGTLDSLPSFLDFIDGYNGYNYLYENENAASHFGKYSEDFSDDNCQGWELTHDSWPCPNSTDQTCNGNSYNRVYDHCSSSYWGWIRTLSPTFELNPDEHPVLVSFVMDTYNLNWGYNSSYIDYNIAYRVDGGEWIDLEDSGSYLQNEPKSFDLSAIGAAENIQFRMSGYFRYQGALTIDNFELTTNFYPGVDVPFTAAAAAASLSTGGIELHNVAFNGDFHSVNDSLAVVLENSSILKNGAREKESHGLGLYADHVVIQSTQSTFANHDLDGVHIESELTDWTSTETLISGNGADGVSVNGDLDWTSTEDIVQGNGEDGIDAGANSNITMFGPEIWENEGRGLAAAEGSVIDIDYARIDGNGGHGIDLENGGSLDLDNSRLLNNGGQGIQSGSPTTLNHCNLAFNGGTGLVLTGNNFYTLNNSILWGNNETNYTQIDIGGGVISTSYSTVQGQSGYGVTGSGQFYWGEGVIEADPLFADDDLHLNTYSPCVDGGQPWLMDAHMPYGLGGVRADMGMYGGPDNGYWGGLALPDGASTLQSVQDSPQDQGNTVGLTFSSSFYDNSELVNNVTHYAFWRHFDPTGAPISDVAEGNWELLGEMPSLSLNNYAYQAPTLGNTNAFGDFSSCYFVAAHTADDDTYWISNVMCGESVDNLAPDDPDLNGLVLETGEAQISWTPPTEEDYAYTEIYNDDGFTAEVGNDTLVIDPSVLPGNSYTYIAVNYDVNGNASEPASLTLDIPAGLDVIPLTAGWNLISTDRSPADAAVASVFAGLNPGNLDYITGFNGGVQFYDPDGLAFLNSLTSLTNGHGYWVRVAEDDTLEVSGASLAANYLPALNAGWNLIGFPNALPATPAEYFASFIAEGTLEYVTGFDGGSTYFDPNGLPFLNSLTALENSFGYWLKVTEAYDPNGMVLVGDEPLAALSGASTAQPNPNFMLVNGTSDLTDAAGEYVDVVAAGRVVGRLPVLEGGYLMTTALFGDDPATPAIEGLEIGTLLEFQFRGALANQT